MTAKEKVQNLWPEAWSVRNKNGSWEIWRHSNWGPHLIGSGKTSNLAWKSASESC